MASFQAFPPIAGASPRTLTMQSTLVDEPRQVSRSMVFSVDTQSLDAKWRRRETTTAGAFSMNASPMPTAQIPTISPRIPSPRERHRRSTVFGAPLQSLQWPPKNDVRWGPMVYPPFKLPWGAAPAMPSESTVPEPQPMNSSLTLDSPAARAMTFAKRRRALLEESAHNAAKVEMGLTQGNVQFSEWIERIAPPPTQRLMADSSASRATLRPRLDELGG